MQIWDVNKTTMIWQAKNVSNDELSLQVPIFDTGLAYIDQDTYAVCTGYGSVRHYDKRAGKKCRSTDEVLKGEMMLTHVLKSKVDPNKLYAIS